MKLYQQDYLSPLGKLSVVVSKRGVVGIWFEGQRHFENGISGYEIKEVSFHREVFDWLDAYFLGLRPELDLPLCYQGTDFQQAVWSYLLAIPYGETRTYGQIVKELQKGSPRSVGMAVGRNPISLLIPCHRILGANGALTGYAGGLDRKKWLLNHEQRINKGK